MNRISANFNRTAATYDRDAHFQQAQLQRLLALAHANIPPNVQVLDIGCGTGMFAALGEWRVIGLDHAEQMCRIAAKHCAATVNGTATALPFADASFDAITSNLCLQWVEELPQALQEMHRVLRPGGIAMLISLGAETLRELRAESADMPLGLIAMRQAAEYSDAATQIGFALEQFDDTTQRHYYPSARALLQSMRQVGAGNPAPRPLAPKRFQAMLRRYDATYRENGHVYASWQPLLLCVRKPA